MSPFVPQVDARAARVVVTFLLVFVAGLVWCAPVRPAFAEPSPVDSGPALSPASAITGARVVVHAVGDRHGDGATSLGGVTFQAYRDAGFTSAAGASCTTDATGDCELVDLTPGTRHYVRAVAAPAPFQVIDTMTTTDQRSRRYGDGVTTGGPGSTTRTRAFVARRTNPPFPGECGVDIALVMDLSNSIDPDELDQMKTAARGFVTALQGTPSSVAGFTFATEAPAGGNADLALTDVSGVSGAEQVRAWIDARTEPGASEGGTNWDAALRQLVPTAAEPDAVVFLTDGSPTFSGDPQEGGNGSDTTVAEVEAGVLSANALKAANPALKVVGIAIGDRAAVDNLGAISGPVLGDDVFLAADFGDLQAKLQELATKLCGGTLTVKKLVDGPDGFRPAAGWTFSVGGATPPSAVTVPDTGVTPAFDVAAGTVTITETRQRGYDLVAQDGRHASCTRNGAPVPPSDLTDVDDGISLPVGPLDIVACEFRNRLEPVTPQVDVAIEKTDRPDPVAAGAELNYDVVVRNVGPVDVTTVEVRDPLPSDTTFVRLEAGAGWTCATPPVGEPGEVLCTRTALAAGAVAQLSLTVRVDPAAAPGQDEIVNTAHVTTPGDVNPADNSATARTTVVRSVDLAVTKSDGGATPVSGRDGFTYTLTVDNRGPSDAATPATVVDVLPDGIDFVEFGALPDGVTCEPPDGRRIECTIGSNLLTVAGPGVVIPVEVTVPAATPGGTVTNRVIVGNDEEPAPCEVTLVTITCDPADTDNYAEVTTPVVQVESEVVPPPVVPPAPRAPVLAFTGSGAVRLAAVGVTLVALGAALIVLVRRRRHQLRG